MRYQADMWVLLLIAYTDIRYCVQSRESAHKEKKKAEDRLKIAVDAQQQSLQRAMDAEVTTPICYIGIV